ncbi:MAG: carboxymuconolactone decarboxylase family protein [Pseudonocardiaceae bacterium]
MATLGFVHLRASQLNGCSSCVDSGTRHAKKAGETDERLVAVAAWRDARYFTDAERGALALSEAVTRLSDRADPVPDEIWIEQNAVTVHNLEAIDGTPVLDVKPILGPIHER